MISDLSSLYVNLCDRIIQKLWTNLIRNFHFVTWKNCEVDGDHKIKIYGCISLKFYVGYYIKCSP